MSPRTLLRRSLRTCIPALALTTNARAQTPSAPGTTADPGLGPEERIYGLSLIWKEVDYNFPYFDQVPELDWDEAFRRFVGPALEAPGTLEYYRVLQRFVGLLKDGHTNVYFPDSISARGAFDTPGIRLEAVGRRAVVENVRADLAESVPPGSEILAVDGIPTERYVADRVLPYIAASTDAIRWRRAIRGNLAWGAGLLVGPPGTGVRLLIRDPAGDEREVEVVRDLGSGPSEWAKPPPDPPPAYELRRLDDGIAYVALNTFSDPELVERFEASLDDLREASGVLIDLRANGGGSDFIATEVLHRLTDRPLVGSGSRIRVNDALYRAYGSFGEAALRAALPEGSSELIERSLAHYSGTAWRFEPPDTLPPVPGEQIEAPVVVLIGPDVASAAENFLVYLPDDGRFTTVGRPTVGSTGQPSRIRLPGGGLARVVSRAAIRADGTTWVGTGIRPDVRVEPTVAEVAGGRDVTLERGLEVLRERIRDSAGSAPEPRPPRRRRSASEADTHGRSISGGRGDPPDTDGRRWRPPRDEDTERRSEPDT